MIQPAVSAGGDVAWHHDDDDGRGSRDLGELAWASDNVRLTTVGIDVGSTTSHLMFARIHLQRSPTQLTSRFEVIARNVLYRSPILLTPYVGDGSIDVTALGAFIAESYRDAGIGPAEVDTGAVILTGAALERSNARRIAELFAGEGGRFVCATAGHTLEATLAAHGSGAVALSAREHTTILNIDVGGGTTKLALIADGEVIASMAVAAGARLVATDGAGVINRLEPSVHAFARSAGLSLELGAPLDPEAKLALGAAVADVIIAAARGEIRERGFADRVLEGELTRHDASAVTLSGGVAELYHGRERREFGDLAAPVARSLRRRAAELGAPIVASAEGIRATVVGASQFTVQVSGNTLHSTADAHLPVHNLPVLTVDERLVDLADGARIRDHLIDARRQRHLEHDAAVAIAVRWRGDPLYGRLKKLAEGIASAHRTQPAAGMLVVACEADIAATLGSILAEDLGVVDPLLVIDGLALTEFDFIDIGERTLPANVIPVVIKSLLFPDVWAEDATS